MDQQGLSLVETLLAVVILFFLTSSIIPLTYSMKQQIAIQQVHTHAAEVAFMGALKYTRYGESAGTQEIDGNVFHWLHNGSTICVKFELDGEEKERCA